MVAVYHRNGEKITKENTLDNLGAISLEKFIWIDLNFSSDEEKSAVEKLFNVRLQTKQQAEEIEQSSRYIESEDHIIVNSNFLVEKEDGYNNEAVSFILVKGTLISYRNADLKSFADTVKKYKVNPQAYNDGYAFLVSFFEMRIDHETCSKIFPATLPPSAER
jgi:magnesium transporter